MLKNNIIKNISITTIIVLSFFLNFSSSDASQLTINDSVHKYNALENKVSLLQIASNMNTSLLETQNNIIYDTQTTLYATQELRDIKNKVNSTIEKAESEIRNQRNQTELETFFIGNNLGKLKYIMVQLKGQISMLNALFENSLNNISKTLIDDQIKLLKQEEAKVEIFAHSQSNKFSLFGWLVASL